VAARSFDGAFCRPESAGANPGPASYRRGGLLTVTDANVVVGKVQPDHFLRCSAQANGDPGAARWSSVFMSLVAQTGRTPRRRPKASRSYAQQMHNAIKKIR
jgi:5-oxoprolinase (ATP-hydrolysing)